MENWVTMPKHLGNAPMLLVQGQQGHLTLQNSIWLLQQGSLALKLAQLIIMFKFPFALPCHF